MSNIYIFGAGVWGDYARCYYEKNSNILGFIDNDKELWNTKKDGYDVFPPFVLNNISSDCIVVIANKSHSIEIRNQLYREYDIHKILDFRININEYPEFCHLNNKEYDDLDELFISFMGGLGNQMFQYAALKYAESMGKNVSADFSWYSIPGNKYHDLMIWDVFPNIDITFGNPDKINMYKKQAHIVYENESEHSSHIIAQKILDIKNGVYVGYSQVISIVESNAELLRNCFKFKENDELKKLVDLLKCSTTVSVHIRRTDYLNKENYYLNVCDDEYYKRAMSYIRKKFDDILWIFFSDDIEWVKENYKTDNAIYIDRKMFESYSNWYDMFLMSLCNHHIIANSTFSWWAAWIDNKQEKIVVAPKKWSLIDERPDICPKSWVRL